jgi:CRISPR/Cas system CSM-associated protein Csm3 (group 7 of RAMP superfamily)
MGASSDFELANYVITQDPMQHSENFVVCPECGCKNALSHVQKFHDCAECNTGLDVPLNSGAHYLYTCTPKQLLGSLSAPERQELLKLLQDANLVQLQQFFYNHRNQIALHGNKRALVAPDVAKDYNEKYGKVKNEFYIEQTITTSEDDCPYLPGTSLKGAIRTALEAANYNKKDPLFSHIKIADALPCQKIETQVVSLRNKKRRYNADGIPPQKAEVIPEGYCFSTEISLGNEININRLKEVCNEFNETNLDYDAYNLQKIYKIPTAFFQKLQKHPENSFLLRLGKHCSAENVTYEKREIKIKGRTSDHATTFWFANMPDEGERPLGWCLAEFKAL